MGSTPTPGTIDSLLKKACGFPSAALAGFALSEGKGSGYTTPTPDKIAASSLRHDLTLLTNNRSHFEGIEGLRIESTSG